MSPKRKEVLTEPPAAPRAVLAAHVKPQWLTPELPDVDWRDMIKIADQIRALRPPVTIETISPVVRIPTETPIAMCLSADWHLGSGATDHAAWGRDMDYLLSTSGLYYAVLGDERENVITFKNLGLVMEQVLPVDQQQVLLEKVTYELTSKGKLLFTTWSNHGEEFDERLIGRSLLEHLRRTQGVPHLNGMGVVRLYVGEELYTILATHKARYSSYLHALHGAKRLYQLIFPADVVAVAHQHRPGHEEYTQYSLGRDLNMGFGGTSWLVACSTYKFNDTYRMRYFGPAPLMLETIVFWPDQHKMECFSDAASAVARIRGLAPRVDMHGNILRTPER